MEVFIWIASTSHRDKSWDIISQKALISWAKQINSIYKPLLIDHDWSKWIWAILYWEVFQLDDGEYALGFVGWMFESEDEKKLYPQKWVNTTIEIYSKFLDIETLKDLADQNKISQKMYEYKSKKNLAEEIEHYFNSTSITPDWEVYTIKKFIASTWSMRVVIYPNDHQPPHFHLIDKQKWFDARINVETLELYSMKHWKISNASLKKIKQFFKDYPSKYSYLITEYNRFNPNHQIKDAP